jgi:hypothetical protein
MARFLPPSQDVSETAKRKRIIEETKAAVEATVERIIEGPKFAGAVNIMSTVISIRDVQNDAAHARDQFNIIEQNGWPVLAAQFRTGGDDTSEIQSLNPSHVLVPIYIPHLDIAPQSYQKSVDEVLESGLSVVEMSPQEGRKTFRDRMVEFLLARFIAISSTGGAGATNPTVVDTRRAGDVVLCCKGYFTSTQTAFGVSTPAQNYLPPGKYGFGIMDNGVARFDPVLWIVPHLGNVRVALP